jgi:hypothetical protein
MKTYEQMLELLTDARIKLKVVQGELEQHGRVDTNMIARQVKQGLKFLDEPRRALDYLREKG